MKRLIVAVSGLALCAGCRGPMTVPAVQRLSPEEQDQVDGMWNNMLSPIDRLDRELLLDVVMFNELHQRGVDRLNFQSEKDYRDGTIVMTVDFVRANEPSADRFTLEIKDRFGQTVRKETYSGAEVMAQLEVTGHPTTRPDGQLTEDDAARQAWAEARLRQIAAATQPANTLATTRPSAMTPMPAAGQ